MQRRAYGLGGCQAMAVMVLASTLLSGCTDKKQSTTKAAAAVADRARDAAEQAIRADTPAAKQMQFRGVQVYAQALPQRTAICGQVSPFADDPNIFVPFVSIVTMPAGQATGSYQFEQHVGTDPSEASWVYIAIVTYCYDKGGPTTAPYQTCAADAAASRQPPRFALQARTAAAPPPAAAHPQTPQASGSVTMRQNGNLHSEPHGPTLRTVPQGTAMRVFYQAPGGWYRGWRHGALGLGA